MAEHYTLDLLQERCALYRDTLLQEGACTEDDLDPHWPGGAENRLDGLDAWFYCYSQCMRRLGIGEGRKLERESLHARSAGQLDILKAQRSDPKAITLVPLTEQQARVVYVYPKSGAALDRMRAIQLSLAYLLDELATLEDRLTEPSDVDLWRRGIEQARVLECQLMWCATHQGHGLPFTLEEADPVLPDWLTETTPIDYRLVMDGFTEVNARRLAALQTNRDAATRPDPTGFMASWSVETGIPVSRLWSDYALAELFATAAELARTRQDAMDDVRAKSAAPVEA